MIIERLLCEQPDIKYNDLAQWTYAELSHAFGCDQWVTATCKTVPQLLEAIKAASQPDVAAYIEVVTDKYDTRGLAHVVREHMKTLYHQP